MKLLIPVLALVSLAQAPESRAFTFSRPTEAETCAKVQEMLFDTQLDARSYNPVEYAHLQRTLKDTYLRKCDGAAAAGGEAIRYEGGLKLWENGRWWLPNGREFTEAMSLDAAANARIVGPFTAAHNRCAPGCGYVSWGIWGDTSHQQRRSCHNSGEAIDIHAITCGGTHKALSARFDQYVDCMRGSLGVIYRAKDHYDHAHFQLHGCNMCQGQGCGGSGGPGKVAPPRDDDGDEGDDDGGSDQGGNDDDGDGDEGDED